jgi:hypothetical protein
VQRTLQLYSVVREEGLQVVFKRLRRNGHQLEKGCCEQLSSDCHSKEAEPQKNSPCVRGMTFGVQAQQYKKKIDR